MQINPGSLIARAQRKLMRQQFLTSKRLAQGWRSWTSPQSPPETVLVAGCQRSGTNMVMTALERSRDTWVYHEYDPKAFDNYLMRPPEVIQSLVGRAHCPRVVIKALLESGHLKDLLATFAPARALWVFRDFRDVVNSHLALWGPDTHRETIDAVVAGRLDTNWITRAVSPAVAQAVVDHGREGVNGATACGLFWYMRNALLFEQLLECDARVRVVQYERLVQAPHGQLAAIFAFLGLEYRETLGEFISPRSVGKSPPPAVAPGVMDLCNDLQRRLEALTVAT
ncbi:MAG: sulfotransferase domain-containing protein [Candidatus Competibacterales bacterium]